MDIISTKKTNPFKKYRYLGNITPEIPETWNHIVLQMLKNIDKTIRPKGVFKWMLNYNFKINKDLIEAFNQSIFILKIKQNFGTLRVSTKASTKEINDIINTATLECNNTCEFCGKKGTTNVTIKNWVRNLCSECIEKNKK